jgi:hypothetical protein
VYLLIKKITLTFHNLGLRSWIECDLCSQCPLDKEKGCCSYSPTYHVLDIAYIGYYYPELLIQIVNGPGVLIQDMWITVNSLQDRVSGKRCRFVSHTGCLIPVKFRESVCRHFICPGIKIWEGNSLTKWQEFFQKVELTETEFNDYLRSMLKESGITLKTNFNKAVDLLVSKYMDLIEVEQQRFVKYPSQEQVVIEREINLEEVWVV